MSRTLITALHSLQIPNKYHIIFELQFLSPTNNLQMVQQKGNQRPKPFNGVKLRIKYHVMMVKRGPYTMTCPDDPVDTQPYSPIDTWPNSPAERAKSIERAENLAKKRARDDEVENVEPATKRARDDDEVEVMEPPTRDEEELEVVHLRNRKKKLMRLVLTEKERAMNEDDEW
ncbi:hypothetical protein EDB19DRAFT_1833932 [Suillus lakei]|nr:hypothetical protein EDB19DRAFT_1833932 [Suillus lakei]